MLAILSELGGEPKVQAFRTFNEGLNWLVVAMNRSSNPLTMQRQVDSKITLRCLMLARTEGYRK